MQVSNIIIIYIYICLDIYIYIWIYIYIKKCKWIILHIWIYMGIWSSNIEDTNHQQANCRWLAAVLNISGLWKYVQTTIHANAGLNPMILGYSTWPFLMVASSLFQSLNAEFWYIQMGHNSKYQGPVLVHNILTIHFFVLPVVPQFWTPMGSWRISPSSQHSRLRRATTASANPRRARADGKTTGVTGGWFSCWKITYSGDFLHGFNVNSRVGFATSIWVDWGFCDLPGFKFWFVVAASQKKNISHLFQLCVYNCIYNYTHINQGKNEISLVFDHH